MKILLTILILALTRAELLERFRTPPITKVEGLVRVYADCDAAFRRAYQQPIATFAADICERLYGGALRKPERFEEPGIVISIGDGRGPNTNVLEQVVTRADGRVYTRIRLPSPGYSDMEALRNAVTRGYARAVLGEEIDAAEAHHRYRALDPLLRAEDRFNALTAWLNEGVYAPGATDESYLADLRRVNVPGRILPEEVRIFASRLYLYPPVQLAPFLGHYSELSFREAIPLGKKDPRILFAAYLKISELISLGGGHGPEMDAAVTAYCRFLQAFASGQKSDAELGRLLTDAELKLKGLTP